MRLRILANVPGMGRPLLVVDRLPDDTTLEYSQQLRDRLRAQLPYDVMLTTDDMALPQAQEGDGFGADSDAVLVQISHPLLLEMLGQWGPPVQVMITHTPGVGTGYDMIARPAEREQETEQA